jgi:hypothetical protein
MARQRRIRPGVSGLARSHSGDAMTKINKYVSPSSSDTSSPAERRRASRTRRRADEEGKRKATEAEGGSPRKRTTPPREEAGRAMEVAPPDPRPAAVLLPAPARMVQPPALLPPQQSALVRPDQLFQLLQRERRGEQAPLAGAAPQEAQRADGLCRIRG